ncbi:unnamed protein product [Rotaria sordida]|uniref:Uncharacterized protein n=1 Tax=Rotaria sordida TaxID=392033 RepID=A0A814FHU9_9BILA|nr:unnamed protein product [Rotaria sordida]CAF4114092.1 unnamed protein product [Rotaria sordida]
MDKTNWQRVAGSNVEGDRSNQLDQPTDVLIDKETDNLIICDQGNRRVVRWSRRSGTTHGETLIDNIRCWGLAMDDQRYLYISDIEKHEVRRYQIGDKDGTIVAGGNGQGNGLNQLNWPTCIFVDQQQTVYVSDNNNHRVMKWNKGAKEGIVVAGGHGKGNAPKQLWYPEGLFVDTLGTIYVADSWNNRVMRWPKREKEGIVIVGENDKQDEDEDDEDEDEEDEEDEDEEDEYDEDEDEEDEYDEDEEDEDDQDEDEDEEDEHKEQRADQLNGPTGLSFDRHGNLYVVDQWNHRVQRFSIK